MTVATRQSVAIQDLQQLHGELHRLGSDLREASLRFQSMVRDGGFQERGSNYAYAADDPKDVLNRSIDITRRFEFLVAVTGAFSSGKSTLLSLLLGQDDLLPASVIPMTAVCTAIRYGDQRRAEVRYVPLRECFERAMACIGQPFLKPFTGSEQLNEALNNPENFVVDPAAQDSLRRFARLLQRYDQIQALDIEFEGRSPFISGGGVVRNADGTMRYFSPTPTEEREYLAAGGDPNRWVTREWLALVRDVCLWLPSPLLENNMVFLDLPGLNCREDYHRRAIREYCNMADCIVVTAFQPGNQADTDVIANFKKLSANYQDKIFFVFNKVDQFSQEPGELVRAVDYLASNTIGGDFPPERFFLTSAHLARSQRSGNRVWRDELERLEKAFAEVRNAPHGLDRWVGRVAGEDDPGGVDHLRKSLYSFLVEGAYPSKVAEVVRNLRDVLDRLREAATPSFDEAVRLDPTDILRRTVVEYYQHVQKLQQTALRQFRYDYLRGDSAASLRQDLNVILEDVHADLRGMIAAHFDRPILASPLLEDPVADFDVLTIADEASRKLRRELEQLVINAIHKRVREVFHGCLAQYDLPEHFRSLFTAAPEAQARLEEMLQRFDNTLLHSQKCIVRTGFFHMPRGRQLKRLQCNVPLSQMKESLVEVFSEFYPSWVYENIFTAVIDKLWLSLFLDGEEFETEFEEFFRRNERLITAAQAADKVEVPTRFQNGLGRSYQSIQMCQEIEELLRRSQQLDGRAASLGVSI